MSLSEAVPAQAKSEGAFRFEPKKGRLETPGNFKDVLTPIEKTAGAAPGTVLDLGCNNTWLAQFYEDYYGLDADPAHTKSARRFWQEEGRWSAAEAEKRIVLGTNQGFPFDTYTFDLVIMRDVLEHVPYATFFFTEAVRVLKMGGVLFVSCPDAQKHVWDEPTHLRPYPVIALRQLAAHNGMETLYTGYESVAPGTQKLARLFGGRTPLPMRMAARLPFWPRNSIAVFRRQ